MRVIIIVMVLQFSATPTEPAVAAGARTATGRAEPGRQADDRRVSLHRTAGAGYLQHRRLHGHLVPHVQVMTTMLTSAQHVPSCCSETISCVEIARFFLNTMYMHAMSSQFLLPTYVVKIGVVPRTIRVGAERSRADTRGRCAIVRHLLPVSLSLRVAHEN